jgi:hypothetical protein
MKTFENEFNKLLHKLKTQENFAFSRFSDGELFIMQNKTVILANDYYVTGDIKGSNIYTEEEQKEFLPARDQIYHEKLLESYKHVQDNYFKGICTGTDAHVGDENFDYQVKLHGGDHETLTFSNLLINANYHRFIEEMVPLFVDREIIYVANKLAATERLPFQIKKKFEIGSNCMINDYNVAEDVKEYVAKNKIRDHIILCSASSLSNFVIYENFKESPDNTYLDIGSCLNPLLNLEGWKHTRGYLTHYWLRSNSPFGTQVDQWGN